MDRIRRLAVCLPLAACVAVTLTLGQVATPRVLRPGETVRTSLPAGDWWKTTVVYALETAPGVWTIEARSLDFDTILRVSRVAHDFEVVIREDDDGGIATNSRVSIEAEEGARYRIEVRSMGSFDGSGEFEVSVLSGRPEPPARKAHDGAEIAYWTAVEERARRTGNVPRRVRALAGRAKVLGGGGFFDRARPLAAEAVALAERELGPDHLTVADSLDVLAGVVAGEGAHAEAKSLCERAVAIREKQLGPDHPDVAASLVNLSWALVSTGSFAEARAAGERAVAIRRDRLGRDHALTAESLRTVAFCEFRVPAYAQAKTLLERILAIRRKELGPDHLQTASSIWALGTVEVADSRREAGLTLLDSSLEIGERGDDLRTAWWLHRFAEDAWRVGHFTAMKRASERALAIRQKLLDPDDASLADGYQGIAFALAGQGDVAGMRSNLEHALRILEKGLGPDDPKVATTLRFLGETSTWEGDYTAARTDLERSLEILEKALGPSDTRVGWSLHHLAVLHAHMGDYHESSRLFERARSIWEKAWGPRNLFVHSATKNHADMLTQAGDYAKALSLYRLALAGFEVTEGPESAWAARCLTGMAELRRRMGNPDEAKRLAERALGVLEDGFPEAHEVEANALRDLGDLAGAREHYERALTTVEKNLGKDHPGAARIRILLARLLWSGGRSTEGFEAALRAEEVAREHLRTTSHALSERQALRYESVRASGLDLVLSIAAGVGNDARDLRAEALDALVRSRALVLDEMAARRSALRAGGDAEVTAMLRDLAAVSTRLANLVVRGSKDEPPESYRKRLDELRRDREKVEESLAKKSSAYRDQTSRLRLGLHGVSDAIPIDGALVSVVLYERHQPSGENTVPSYLVFVLRRGSREPALVDLGAAETIDALVHRWRKEAGLGVLTPGRPQEADEAAYRIAGAALYRAVWEPVAARLAGAKKIFVVPDGALNLVSLAALPIGRSSYLVEREPLIHYLSAERDLVSPTIATSRGEGLLAVGDPAFEETSLFSALAPGKPDAGQPALPSPADLATLLPFRRERSACASFQSIHFEPLPASAREVGEVAALWMTAGASTPATVEPEGSGGVITLTESKASEAEFKRQASGRRVLHLATHGFFLGGHCTSALDSSRGFGAVTTVGSSEPPPVIGENPLLLSGLALAGANHRTAAGPGEEDGVLTAEEVAAMDLSGLEWAVLSACDTGVGEIKAGEGVFGLRRAFQIAGAKTLIMSLWSVNDEAAREWMERLYRGRFVQGLDTAHAAHAASLAVLGERRRKEQGTHPFYWAGFVAAGDWR